MYLPPTSGVESFCGKSKPRRNMNSNLNNLVIGFYYQNCEILENRPKWLLAITFGGLQRVGLLKRDGKYSLLMHTPIFAVFSLFSLPLSLFISLFLSVLFTFIFFLLSSHGLFLLLSCNGLLPPFLIYGYLPFL